MDRDYIRITSADPDDPEPKTLLNLKTSWCAGKTNNLNPFAGYSYESLYQLENGEWLVLMDIVDDERVGTYYRRATPRQAAEWCVDYRFPVPAELEAELKADCIGAPSSESPCDFGEPWGAEGFVELPNGDIGIATPLPNYPDEMIAEFATKWQAFVDAPAEPANVQVTPRATEAAVEALADSSVRGIVLNFERPHSALKDLIRELDALPKQLRIVSLLGSSRAEPLTEAQPAAVDALPVEAATVELAPESKAAVEAPDKRLWTVAAAQPIVYAYLKRHPNASQKKISRDTGISHGTVGKTIAFRKREARRKRQKENQQGKRAAMPLTENIMAIAKRVSGPDVDVDGVVERCAVDPEYREELQRSYKEMMADDAQRRRGRRSTV